MDIAEITDIKNLIASAKNMKNLADKSNDPNGEEIIKIRTFCIEAIKDYADVTMNLTALINQAHELFPKPYVYGERKHELFGSLGDLKMEYTWNRGEFHICCKGKYTTYIAVTCTNVSGQYKYGYCGHGENKCDDSSKWIATDVCLGYDEAKKFEKDLIGSHPCGNYNLHYTIPYLETLNTSLENWVELKRKAELTRERTKHIITLFKSILKDKAEDYKKQVSDLVAASQGEYKKVTI